MGSVRPHRALQIDTAVGPVASSRPWRRLLRRRYGYYWSKLIGLPLVLAGGLLVFVWIGDTWWQLFTAVFLAVVFTQIAFLGHDSAHRQIFVSEPDPVLRTPELGG